MMRRSARDQIADYGNKLISNEWARRRAVAEIDRQAAEIGRLEAALASSLSRECALAARVAELETIARAVLGDRPSLRALGYRYIDSGPCHDIYDDGSGDEFGLGSRRLHVCAGDAQNRGGDEMFPTLNPKDNL